MTDSRTWKKPTSAKDEQEIATAIQSHPDLVYVRIENEKEVRLSFVEKWELETV